MNLKNTLALLILLSSLNSFGETPSTALMEDYEGMNEILFDSEIRNMSALEKSQLLAKNIALVIVACPTLHVTQFVFAVGESIPVLSAGVQLTQAVIDGPILKNEGRLTESGSAYFLGGPLNALFQVVYQIYQSPNEPGFSEDAILQIKKAFKDGYFATRKAQDWNRVCYTSERRVQMLLGLSTRIK